MKILVIGGGGREHALVWKISRSPKVKKIYCAPGNPGTAQLAENVAIKPDDIQGLADFASKEGIDLTVVGPELPLTLGIVDEFEGRGLSIFGPDRRAAEIERSKAFSKRLMKKYGIPTARFETFESADAAKSYIKSTGAPVVVKADGLAAGKGVLLCHDPDTAFNAVDTILLDKKFGIAGNRIVVEELLEGDEVSFMAFTDGERFLPMIFAKDHKPVYDGNRGPNTGGMGAYASEKIVGNGMYQKITRIMEQTVNGMASEGRRYKGVLYAGLMISGGEPLVLEFNCRFGDPETQPVMMKMKSDIVPIMEKVAAGALEGADLEWRKGAAACVVMASGGYPGTFEKGKPITGLADAAGMDDAVIFHAGTLQRGDEIVTNGGRVLGVTAWGENIGSAVRKAYELTDRISWDGVHYRRDIGKAR